MIPPPFLMGFPPSEKVVVVLTKLRETRSTPGGNCAAAATLIACPSTRFAAVTTWSGRKSMKSGRIREFRDSATPRSSTPTRRRKRPTSESSLVVIFEKLISPVRCERINHVAVAVSPGRIVPSSTRSGLCSTPPETLSAFSEMLTRFATVFEVFKMVAEASYGSPVLTVLG